MHKIICTSPTRLSNEALLARVKRLARGEREATAELVAHLAELDERRLHLREGCSSLFTYCVRVLHLAEHAAFNRIEAARASRRFPVLLEHLADGSLHLAAIRLLAPHLTDTNHEALLAEARHRSKRDVEAIVARIRPLPPVPSTVRKLPEKPAGLDVRVESGPGETGARRFPDGAGSEAGCPPDGATHPNETGVPVQAAAVTAPRPPAERTVVAPLAPRRYRIQFTADEAMHAHLMEARDLLRHRIPDGDPAGVFAMALEVLLVKLRNSKRAEVARPRTSRRKGSTAPGMDSAGPRIEAGRTGRPKLDGGTRARRRRSRHISAAVRRTVWIRDGGRCTFAGREGRCGERGFLEFHHRKAFALGGDATVDNIALRCRAHNLHEAEALFGTWGPPLVRERGGDYSVAGPPWPMGAHGTVPCFSFRRSERFAEEQPQDACDSFHNSPRGESGRPEWTHS